MMVSSYGYIPVLESGIIIERYERSRDLLTSQIKEAVNKVHNLATARSNVEPKLQSNFTEVLFLCESLDRALLHGLKELPYGYWPFVKEFTHPNGKVYLESLANVTTSLGLGRAWLCQALNESSLESYISSFLGNPRLLEQHYIQPALLRDTQRMQLVLTLMAGLEYVGFDIPADLSTWDTLGFANIVFKPDSECDIDTLSASSIGQESKSNCTSVTPVSMQSLADEESTDMMSIDSAFEATDEKALLEECLPNCHCKICNLRASLIEEQQRVSRLIGLDPDGMIPDDTLMVTRTKISKPRRKRDKMNDSPDNGAFGFSDSRSRNNDSSSSDKSESNENCDKNCAENEPLEAVTNDRSDSEKGLEWLGERGVPEGQEDPETPDSNQELLGMPLQQQDDGSFTTLAEKKDAPEEEISIYDVANNSAMENVINKNLTLRDSLALSQWISELSISSLDTSHSDNDAEVEALKQEEQMHDRSLRVDNNVLLYLTLEIFQYEDEKLYKVFLASTKHDPRGPDLSYVVITSHCFYILLIGNEKTGRFRIKSVIPFDKIDGVDVNLNYQSFVVKCHGGILKCPVFTGSDFLTRSILSNLDVSIRRKGLKELPSISLWPSAHIKQLLKIVGKELMLKRKDVDLSYFALIQWENFMGLSPATTPAGPIQEGFLMYKHKLGGASVWTPGYFQLKGGVLYCYKDSSDQTADFYFQLHYPHFNGCRRCQSSNRPHAFEMKLRGKDKLILAAANDTETSAWLQAILQTVSLMGHLNDVNYKKTLLPCSIVVANSVFFILAEGPMTATVAGKASLQDLVCIRVDVDAPTNCILEFESGEANSCSGDWILMFADVDEKEKFLAYISVTWESMFQVSLNVSPLKDLGLWNRCREHYENQNFYVEKMQALLRDES